MVVTIHIERMSDVSRQVVLQNPNKFTVPVLLRRDGQVVQVNISPKSSIIVEKKELTPSVDNILKSKKHLLTMKRA